MLNITVDYTFKDYIFTIDYTLSPFLQEGGLKNFHCWHKGGPPLKEAFALFEFFL